MLPPHTPRRSHAHAPPALPQRRTAATPRCRLRPLLLRLTRVPFALPCTAWTTERTVPVPVWFTGRDPFYLLRAAHRCLNYRPLLTPGCVRFVDSCAPLRYPMPLPYPVDCRTLLRLLHPDTANALRHYCGSPLIARCAAALVCAVDFVVITPR